MDNKLLVVTSHFLDRITVENCHATNKEDKEHGNYIIIKLTNVIVLQTSNFNGFKDSTSKKFLKTQYFKNTVGKLMKSINSGKIR